MSFLRKFFLGAAAALAICASAPRSEASPLDMRPKDQIEEKVKDEPYLPLPPSPDLNLEERLKQPLFEGSSFGLSIGLNYSIPGAFRPDLKGNVWYGSRYYSIGEDPISVLQFYSHTALPTTPIDSMAYDLLNFRRLGDTYYGYFTVKEMYNIFRLFSPLASQSWDGHNYVVKGDLTARTDSHADLFTSHLFTKGPDLIRYDHGIAATLLGQGQVSVDARIFKGDGVRFGLHELERYLGSSMDLSFLFRYLADLTVSESHQLSFRIPGGWQGIGLEYQEFFRAHYTDLFTISARSPQNPFDDFLILDASASDVGSSGMRYGNSSLLYLFREQSFRNFWYYLMLGASLSDQTYSSMVKDESDSIVIGLDSKMLHVPDYFRIESAGKNVGLRFNYAFLVGFDFAGMVRPYFGSTNYPYDRVVNGVSFAFPYFVADVNLDSGFVHRPSAEFYIPLRSDSDYKTPLLDFFRERSTVLISPFSAKHSMVENLRRRAYSRLEGHFIVGESTDQLARLSYLGNNGRLFGQIGVEADLHGDGAGVFTRLGYRNLGLLLHYSGTVPGRDGHSVSLAFTGDFDRYYFRALAKGLWLQRPDGIMHTPFDVIYKGEKYVLFSFGGVF